MPDRAASAGTFLALAADEIVMSDMSSLRPSFRLYNVVEGRKISFEVKRK